MRFLRSLAFTALAVAAPPNYDYPGEDIARLNATQTSSDLPDLSHLLHPELKDDLNYLRARGDNVVPGVYVCEGPGWQNNCVWQRVVANVCMALPDSKTLAVGPDIGVQCMFASGDRCDQHTTSGSTVTPGVTNFLWYDGLPRTPLSYKCKPCADPECGKPWHPASPWTTPPCATNWSC